MERKENLLKKTNKSNEKKNDLSTNYEKPIAHILLLLVNLGFSGWQVLGSYAIHNKGADAMIFALYREILATLFMGCFVIYRGIPMNRYCIDTQDFSRFFYLGFCSFGNVVFTILSLQYLSANSYSVMQPIIPVIAMIISISIGLEPFTLIKVSGIALAVCGALFIEFWKAATGEQKPADNIDYVLGIILVVLQVFLMANLIVYSKSMLIKYDPPLVTFIYYSIGSTITLILAICWHSRYKSYKQFYFDGEPFPWIALAYASIVATMFAYNALGWSGRRLVPSITSVYNTIQPIGTVCLSYIFLGDVVTINELFGGLFVIIGLILTVIGRHSELLNQKIFNKVSSYNSFSRLSINSSHHDPSFLFAPIQINDDDDDDDDDNNEYENFEDFE
jgi:drug/metabolite transporter (DMT)-like permease